MTAAPSKPECSVSGQTADGQSQPLVRIAVLVTCFNRREKTLACLQSLWPQLQFRVEHQQQQVQARLFLLDNGHDGTGQQVQAEFPEAVVWFGQPDWYWNSGMRQLWQRVVTSHNAGHFDYFLWLNDDVQLQPDALPHLLGCACQLTIQNPQPLGAVVGSMAGRQSDGHAGSLVPTYGGRLRKSTLNPVAFGPVLVPQAQPQRCDFINGNLCLISKQAVATVGLLSADFTHGLGDFDYGLRLQQAGFGLWVAPGFYGICETNPPQGSVFDAALPLRQRLALLQKPNIMPAPAEWRCFARRHARWYWPLAYGAAYFRQLFPWAWLYVKQRHFAASTQALKRVLVVQQVFKHYRLALFRQLAAALAAEGIELTIAFSKAQGGQRLKQDNIESAEPGFSQLVPVYQFGPLVWQSVPDLARYDVVVVEQANRHLLNYWLLLRRFCSHQPKLVFWGHGFNHQAHRGAWSAIKEWGKRRLLGYADAFFAYTQAVADFAGKQGVRAERICVLNNSIDTSEFAGQVRRMRADTQRNAPYTLLFCGSLYPDKLLAELLAATEVLVATGLVKKLIIIGDGPQRSMVSAVQATWLDYRGACFAEDKAAAFAEADLVLNPGLVGLAILDAFAAGLPLVTTDFPGHSPEITYLQHGVNGLILPRNELVAGLTALLQQPGRLQQLAAGAADSSGLYSLEATVQAFVKGLQPLLPGPKP